MSKNKKRENVKSYFSKDQEMRLYDGTEKTVNELEVGDELIGLNSEPTKITKIYKSNEELYEICQDYGNNYVVDGNHILVLKFTNVEGIYWSETKNRQRWKARYIQNLKIHDKSFALSAFERKMSKSDRKEAKEEKFIEAQEFLKEKADEPGYNKIGDILEISVNDYLKLPTNVKRILYCYKTKVNYPEQDVEIDPYILGLWLGDGHTWQSRITNIDKEIVDYIREYAEENDLKMSVVGNSKITYSITRLNREIGNTFLKSLQSYDLIGNKHIPFEYLQNNKKTRLAVLAGLIDTDGYLKKDNSNTYEIMQKSIKIANDIVILSRSLGFKISINKVKKTCTNTKKGPVTNWYYRMHISGEGLDKIPVLLKRKKAKPASKGVDFLITQFKIKELESSKCIGFKIDNKSKKFIGKDFTVMHC